MVSTTSADQLAEGLQGIDSSSFASETERTKARDALFAALRRVQLPWDVAMDHVWTEPATTAAIKTLIDVGFWRKWVAAGGQPADVHSLAEMGGVDPVLLRRLLRELAGQRFVVETDKDAYALTAYTRALAEPLFPSLYTFLYEMNQPCFANYPKFASETAYQNPSDPANSNFQSWKGADQALFTVLAAKPEVSVHFNNAMTVYSAAKTPWVDIYPTEDILAAAKPSRALVVDVGGGAGHDIEKFRTKHPNVPAGSLILQDLPNVVGTAKPKAPIEGQGYDFFTPEPVKGARVYYLHIVLHDWADEKAVEILKNLAGAMEKGYSRILLHENVIAPQDAHPRSTLSDLVMMMSFSAVERSEAMWRDVITRAGLRITKIWSVPEAVESIIEIEL